MTERLVLAQGRARMLDRALERELAGVSGYLGGTYYTLAPAWRAHPQAKPWCAVAFHKVASPLAGAQTSAILAGDPALSDAGAITVWRALSSHKIAQPIPGRERGLFIVLAKPKAGREAEYDAWYRAHHVQDMLGVAGFISCDRYEAEESGAAPWRFLAVYELSADNLAEAIAAEQRRISMPDIVWTDAKDSKATIVLIVEEAPT